MKYIVVHRHRTNRIWLFEISPNEAPRDAMFRAAEALAISDNLRPALHFSLNKPEIVTIYDADTDWGTMQALDTIPIS